MDDDSENETSVVGYLSFDIEITSDFEMDDDGNFKNFENITPSCMAYTIDGKNVSWWWDKPHLSKEKAKRFVRHVRKMMALGYAPVTWNGTAFDWRVLAHYTGMLEEVAEIALFSYDLMLSVTFRKGYFLGLEKALIGAELETKIHKVTLNDGTILEDMSGKLAPELWDAGEYKAVLEYLKGDVVQPYLLTKQLEETERIKWFSNSGKAMSCFAPLQNVASLFAIKPPNTSWMESPPKRTDFIKWMPEGLIEKHAILRTFEEEEK